MGARVQVARRQLAADRRRVVVSMLGIGASLALILLLDGLWGGTVAQVDAYKQHAGADLFVAGPDTRTSFGSSLVTLGAVPTIRRIAGVTHADPVIVRSVILELHGHKVAAGLVGSPPRMPGGAWAVAEGRNIRADGEVVVDRVLAHEHGFMVGDTFTVLGHPFRLIGLSDGTRSWMTGYVFMTHADAERLLGMTGLTSFVLVRTTQPSQISQRIEGQLPVKVLTRDALMRADRDLYAGIMERPLAFMIGIAFAAGTIITALTAYSAVAERIREYGIIRAVGATSAKVFRIISGQTLLMTSGGLLASIVLFLGSVLLISAVRPRFWITVSARSVAQVAVAAMAMALLGAIVPARRVVRVDPASVYRGT